jgi:hypothetical protein
MVDAQIMLKQLDIIYNAKEQLNEMADIKLMKLADKVGKAKKAK